MGQGGDLRVRIFTRVLSSVLVAEFEFGFGVEYLSGAQVEGDFNLLLRGKVVGGVDAANEGVGSGSEIQIRFGSHGLGEFDGDFRGAIRVGIADGKRIEHAFWPDA